MMRKSTFAGLNIEPKSKRGWREWERKYARAFLSDQLDRKIECSGDRRYIMSLLRNWERRFRQKFPARKPQQWADAPLQFLDDQINFVTEYVACAVIDAAMAGTYEKIKRFLSMQTADDVENRFELRLVGGNHIEPIVYVDSLRDIDVADIFYVTDFECMFVRRPRSEKWTVKTAKLFLADLKQDILFDFPNAVIKIDGPRTNIYLTITVEVDEAARSLKALQCMPQKFAERFTIG